MARRERVNGHFKARVNLITCYMFKITFLMRQPLAETQCDTVSGDVRGRSKCFLVCLRVLCDSTSDVCSKSLECNSREYSYLVYRFNFIKSWDAGCGFGLRV